MSPKLLALALAVIATLAGVGAVAHAEPTATDKAASHYKQGAAFYAQKLYAQALDEFQAAYDLDPKPLLHYHMARAQQGAGHRQDALELFRRYLDEEPSGKGADDARKQVAILVKDLVDNPPPPPPDQPAPPPPVISHDAPTVAIPIGHPLPPIDAPPPPPIAHPRHPDWRFVGAGAAAIVLGVLADTLPSSASNKHLDALDFVPAACYAGGATLVFVGVF